MRAWDINCPQHIPQKIEAPLVAAALQECDARIAILEATITDLRAQLDARADGPGKGDGSNT